MYKKVAVLIPAGGASVRFGQKTKKQFSEINGRAVFLHTIEKFSDRDDVAQIILAIPPDDEEIFHIRHGDKLGFWGIKCVLGGNTRDETIGNMLNEVKDDIDLIAIHDAVRPCITQSQIDEVFAKAASTGAAILANPICGTVKKSTDGVVINETIDRAPLWEAQTPQVFATNVYRNAFKNKANLSETITDDAQLVEASGHNVSLVKSDTTNIKITTSNDLVIVTALIDAAPKPIDNDGPVGPYAAEQGW
jgi:2-C-methyl-D-erythritol 4-phosphate cytidylyltransferase